MLRVGRGLQYMAGKLGPIVVFFLRVTLHVLCEKSQSPPSQKVL